MDSAGRDSDGMRAVDRLQGHEDRDAFLREMVMSFRPPEPDPELWLRWLSGGVDPFAQRKLTKPRMAHENTKRELLRASNRVMLARGRVDDARCRLAEAEAEAARCLEFESALVS